MKPILFNTEMVKAILDGRKTVTRRLIKPKYRDDEYGFQVCHNSDWSRWYVEKMDADEGGFDDTRYVKPPYQPGYVLYVRETFMEVQSGYLYRANYEDESAPEVKIFLKWKPSIHMPKKAARIFLKVTDVRVEQLQEITVDGAYREGADISQGFKDFIEIWNNTINVSNLDNYGWGANPWVWVIRFERTKNDERSYQ